MNIFDSAVMLTMNDWGNVTLKFERFTVNNTAGGDWWFHPNYAKWPPPDERVYYPSIHHAYYAAMEALVPDAFKKCVHCDADYFAFTPNDGHQCPGCGWSPR